MFRNILTKTPLYDETINDHFTNIIGVRPFNDVSFVSTLRALVAKRMNDDERVSLLLATLTKTKEQIYKSQVHALLYDAGFDVDYCHQGDIFLCNLCGDSEDSAAKIQYIKANIAKECPSWRLVDKVEAFFRRTFSVCCFVNQERKSVIIFVDNMDIRKYHYLQCGIPAFMPWYFDAEKSVSEKEKALIMSLREKTSEKYERCLAEIASTYNFREFRIKKLLSGFETRCEEAEINRVEREIAGLIRKINEYNSAIGRFLADKSSYETRMAGLQKRVADASKSNEIMEYFLCNKNLILEKSYDTMLTFSTIGYITYFDEDEAENVIDNPNSYIYNPSGRDCNNIIPATDMKMLMSAIFLKRTLKMKFCSSYTFNLNGNVIANKEHDYSAIEFNDCTPNTHIDRYGCMGDYTRIINELLMDRNYIGAIDQCIASTVSLNFSDICVMNEFMCRLYGISDSSVNIRCIELPDGSVVNPKQAIEYLKAQEVETNG